LKYLLKSSAHILQVHGLSKQQIKEKEKAMGPEEHERLQNIRDVTSVIVTKPLESLNIGLVSLL